MTSKTAGKGSLGRWATVTAALLLLGTGVASCSTTAKQGPSGAPNLPTPLETSVQTADGTWATIPMGNLDQPVNTFWQLFFRPTGTTRWSNQVGATATATNGGLVLASAQERSLVVGIRPSQNLEYTPLIATSDAASSWSNGLLTEGLAERPDALAVDAGGQALALVGTGEGAQVLTSSGDISTWRRLATERALAAGPARSCGLALLTAVGYLGGEELVGGSCSRRGTVGLFSYAEGSWRRAGPALRRPLEDGRVEVLALEGVGGEASALLAVATGHKTYLVAAWSDARGRWSTSSPWALSANEQVASFGPANGGDLFVLLQTPSKRASLIVSGPSAAWRELPPPPAGTATIAFGGRPPVALAVSNQTVLTVYSLEGTSKSWAKGQVVHVPVQFGSSS